MKAPVLYYNAKIFTADDKNLFCDAMIVEGSKIKWVGNQANIIKSPDKKINVQGKRIIPGLIDSHLHPLLLAQIEHNVPCLPPIVNSIEELKTKLQEKAKSIKNNKWIEAWGFDESKLKELRAPNRYDLDEAVSEIPIIVTRTCAHVVAVNSKALELAGITKATINPEGGEIERNKDGEPTGVLRESATELVTKLKPKETIKEEVDKLVQLSHKMFSKGIVSVTDLYSTVKPDDYYEIFMQAKESGYKQRTVLYYRYDNIKNHEIIIPKERLNRENQIYIGGVKVIMDGSVSGQTALTYNSYLNSSNEYGIPVSNKKFLLEACDYARKHDVQLSVHAMGDKAIDLVVDSLFEKPCWIQEGPSVRIEHVTIPTQSAIRKASISKIAFVPQSIFLFAEFKSYLNNFGYERTRKAYPIKTFLENNVLTSLSSDAPATSWADPINPFVNMQAAVTRKSYNNECFGQEECIDIETAIKLYTKHAQEVTRIPNVGQIKRGYDADFLILKQDLIEVNSEDIGKTLVEKTYLRGEEVYSIFAEKNKVKGE